MAIKVLVVDDSAFMRKLISEILSEHDDIKVVATARNGLDGLEKLNKYDIDVVTLDLEMPVLDGLATIEKIMSSNPLPILVLSGVTERSLDYTMKALSKGAIDFIAKPSGSISLDLRKVSEELVTKLRSLAKVTPKQYIRKPPDRTSPRQTITSPKIKGYSVSKNIIVIGASTGGPRALEQLLVNFPPDVSAGILVVQHMPKNFTRSLAVRLDSLSALKIREANEGDYIIDGQVLIAPGDYHLKIDKNKQIMLNQEPPVKYLRPAIDVTMLSLPQVFRNHIIGVILTGMGSDGAVGMACIKEYGGYTIAQDEATSTIYSMPRAVYEQGNADYVLPLEKITDCVVSLTNKI